MSLTVKALIARHLEREKAMQENSKKSIFVESLNGELEFERPSREDALDILNVTLEASYDAHTLYRESRKLIYNCCPALREKELHESLGVVDPYEVVDKLLDVNEVINLGGEIAEFSRVNIKSVDEAIKNS